MQPSSLILSPASGREEKKGGRAVAPHIAEPVLRRRDIEYLFQFPAFIEAGLLDGDVDDEFCLGHDTYIMIKTRMQTRILRRKFSLFVISTPAFVKEKTAACLTAYHIALEKMIIETSSENLNKECNGTIILLIRRLVLDEGINGSRKP